MSENKPGLMLYQSVVKGITQAIVDGPVVYYGFSFRHTRADGKPDLEVEMEMVKRLDDLLNGNGLKEREAAFVVNGVLERYDIFDVDSDDVLVMYRVPCSYYQDIITSPKVESVELVCHPCPFPQPLLDRVTDLGVRDLVALRIIIDSLLTAKGVNNGNGPV